MIREIVNFVNDLPTEVFGYNLKLEDGLYIEIEISEEGEIQLVNQEGYNVKPSDKGDTKREKKGSEKTEKRKELSDFLQKCLTLQTVTKHEFQINKCFNSSEKIFFQTASPFMLGFKKETIEEKIEKENDKLPKAIKSYFGRANDFISLENKQHLKWLEQFKKVCTSKLLVWLRQQKYYTEANKKTVIRVFYNTPAFEDFQEVYNNYLNENALFDAKNGYGISEMLSKFPDQKVFMQHKSAPFLVNFRLPTEDAKAIWQFFQLRKRVLPNPLPVFIDKRELNGKMIRIINDYRDAKPTYLEILKRLFEEVHESDLGGYYLLFFLKGEMVDLDYVPSFRYKLKGMRITEVFPLGGKMDGTIENVLEFESKVANKMFDGKLIVEQSNWLKYFGDVDFDKYISHNTYNQLLKYRKSFYDFIYKSKREAIQNHSFQDIMRQGIHDFIRRDKNMEHDYAIKEKLNIWFSLYYYFEINPQNHQNMVNKTQDMLVRMREIEKSNENAFLNDDEFAFACGQLIRFLVSQSETATRTHSLLEPFLQKVEPELFKLAIARAFDTYKHAIPFYKGNERYAFDKLMSITMGHEPAPHTHMKSHLPMVLAGYFSETVFKKESSLVSQVPSETTNANA